MTSGSSSQPTAAGGDRLELDVLTGRVSDGETHMSTGAAGAYSGPAPQAASNSTRLQTRTRGSRTERPASGGAVCLAPASGTSQDCYTWAYVNPTAAAAAAAASSMPATAAAAAASGPSPQPVATPAGAAVALAGGVATAASMQADEAPIDGHSCRSGAADDAAGVSVGRAAERSAGGGPGPGSERDRKCGGGSVSSCMSTGAAGCGQGSIVREVTGQERERLLAAAGFVLTGGAAGGAEGSGAAGPQQQQQQLKQHPEHQPHQRRHEGPGSWQQPLAADAVVFVCDLDAVTALGEHMRRSGTCPAALRDLTGCDFAVFARLPPPRPQPPPPQSPPSPKGAGKSSNSTEGGKRKGGGKDGRRRKGRGKKSAAVEAAVVEPLPVAPGDRLTPLVVCRQAPADGALAPKLQQAVEAFEQGAAGGVFNTQRRSANKTAAVVAEQPVQASGRGGGRRGAGQRQLRQVRVAPPPLGTTGMVWAKTTPTAAPGLYAHLLEPTKGPARVARMREVMAAASALLEAQHPRHMTLLREHGRGREHHGAGTGPFCSMSYTLNYYNRVHFDQDDPALSFITWLLVGAGELCGGAFRLGNLHLRFTPLHGTTLLLNTRLVAHGTEPCATLSGDLRRLGSAAWVRHCVVAAVERWRVGARKEFTRNRPKAFSDPEAYALWRVRKAAELDRAHKAAVARHEAEPRPRGSPSEATLMRRSIMACGDKAAEALFDWEVVREAEGCWDVVQLPGPEGLGEEGMEAEAEPEAAGKLLGGSAAALQAEKRQKRCKSVAPVARRKSKRKQAEAEAAEVAVGAGAVQRARGAAVRQPQQQQLVALTPAEAVKQRKRKQVEAVAEVAVQPVGERRGVSSAKRARG
ncbi:hypothetical protein CHLRE_06g255800v5 [Chlamydomonas reinhardtii]|uniref:Uncharacterized protein n=1 Tax=Chlamydomonas reinhardtii TaxID=3055 RepID=A0A2K3DMB3_CHLRE|nr:uncharacterized protein CHLRE_06g255800v5 [Chlamydomonas reinhardtii]PNW81677.1 hypothetical protein CHLRE_06g255800v5 [Chlamydomonas reinhardtii]